MIDRPIVDVSHHQPHRALSWRSASNAGILGCIAKASQGVSFIDPEFPWHMYGAQQGGVSLLGAYHFLDASDPVAQAQNFVSAVKAEFGATDGILMALDAEFNQNSTATVEQVAAAALAVRDLIGRMPVLYMGRYGPDGRGTGLPNDTLSQMPLWLPEYGATAWLPPGFVAAKLWQDTDGTANGGQPVPGLGRVDQSRALGMDDTALRAWWGT